MGAELPDGGRNGVEKLRLREGLCVHRECHLGLSLKRQASVGV